MKKLLTLIAFICFWANANAQYVNIPDSNFRKFLMKKYPSCFDSLERMDTTCNILVTDTFLSCSFNSISNLTGIQYFDNLRSLYVSYNKLSNLPPLPSNLDILDCGDNQLINLPSLPLSLKILLCRGNQFVNLPQLPLFLKELDCSSNSLFSLPVLPNTLKSLNCDFNQLTTLPNLPNSLVEISCSDNQLSQLPKLPNSLLQIDCSNNSLSNLPKLSDTMDILVCNGNNIICLPKFPNRLRIIKIDASKIKCFVNKPVSLKGVANEFGQGIAISTFPICNPTNNLNHCQSFPFVQFYTYIDNNSNNKKDITEYPKHNLKLTLSNNNYTYTNTQGTAFINADSLGTYTLTAQAPPLYKAVPASYTHTFNSYDTLVYDTFALQPLVTKDSLSIDITPLNWAARPGFKYVYKCEFENVGTTILNANLSCIIDTSQLVLDSTSNNAVSFSGNSLSYAVNNFVPGQNGSFLVYCTVKPTAVLGSSLQATASITGGNTAAYDTANTIIRGSFDPNDKQATPNLTVQQVASNNSWINYTIRFENTGTDTAFTVVVADTLDASRLQTNTVQITGTSHNVKATQNDNIIFFEFRNINLPDSTTDKIKCNGFVSFKAKPLTSLVNGMTVPNKAAIYFDYNSPVITNTAQTIIGTLPLSLTSFGAINKPEENNIFVYWNTANEINTSFFIIERSSDGRNFLAAAEVAAIGKGNNNYYHQLTTANSQQPTVYLRLKMVDKNGTFTYSNVAKLAGSEKLVVDVSPNPAKNVLNIKVLSSALHNTRANLVTVEGKIVKSYILKQGNQTIDITTLPKGLYYLQTNDGTKKVVKE